MSSNEDQQISANKLFAAIQKMENSFQKALQRSTTELMRFRRIKDSPILTVLETDRLNQRQSHYQSPSPRHKEPERSRHWDDRTDTVLDLPPIRDDEWGGRG